MRPIRTAIAAIVPIVALVGCGSGNSQGSATGSLIGTVADSSGSPIAGATVVAGHGSPTAITGPDGSFTLLGVPTGSVPVKTIVPGYVTIDGLFANVTQKNTTPLSAIQIPDVDDPVNAPQVTQVSVTQVGGSITVTATLSPGVLGDSIQDARAELVGYGIGGIMSATDGAARATLTLPGIFSGSYALVAVFAIDAKGRVGEGMGTVLIPSASGAGIFTASALTGTWGGALEYHHPSLSTGEAGDKRFANVTLTVSSGGAVSGAFDALNVESYISAASWGVTSTPFTGGTLSLLDANLGLFQITASMTSPAASAHAFDPASSVSISITLIGKLDSETAPTHLEGFMSATFTDATHTTSVSGHFHVATAISWSTGDLNGNWVWSEFIKASPTGLTGTYQAPFQYNSSLGIRNGTISGGADTIGNTLITSTAFSVDAQGRFIGSFNSTDGSTVSFTGLIGPFKEHVAGSYTVSKSGQSAYGVFWGDKIAASPQFSTTDFGPNGFSGLAPVAIWRGFYRVTGTHHQGSTCYLSLWTRADGSVVGGIIRSLDASSCPAVTFTSGSLSFANQTDQTSGKVTGSATGGTTTLSFGPSNSRNASIGVEKARLVGDFSVNFSGGSTDTGYCFLQRTFIE